MLRRQNVPFGRACFGGSLSLLITLGIGLALERLVRDLFAAYPALGYVGLGLIALLVVALLALIIREMLGLRRLKTLAKLKREAHAAHSGKNLPEAQKAVEQLRAIYEGQPHHARQLAEFDRHAKDIWMATNCLSLPSAPCSPPLDEKAKAIIANSAQRISLVTAVSPRAFFDIMFVLYESARLTRRIAQLYGARPSFFGFIEMSKSVMAHLALTGGIALGDSVVQQLLGHGLAARLSAKLAKGDQWPDDRARRHRRHRVIRPLPICSKRPCGQRFPARPHQMGARRKHGKRPIGADCA